MQVMELPLLLVDEGGIEPVVERTATSRVSMGWSVFHVGTCAFEMDRWVADYDVSVNIDLGKKKRWEVEDAVAQAEMEIRRIVSRGNVHVS